MARFLIDSCKINESERLDLFQTNNKIKERLSSSESSLIQEFKTFEEAKAFNQGIIWAVKCFGGTVGHYVKDINE